MAFSSTFPGSFWNSMLSIAKVHCFVLFFFSKNGQSYKSPETKTLPTYPHRLVYLWINSVCAHLFPGIPHFYEKGPRSENCSTKFGQPGANSDTWPMEER